MKYRLPQLAFTYYLITGIISCYITFFLLWLIFWAFFLLPFGGDEIPTLSTVTEFIGWPLSVLILFPGFIAFCAAFLWWRFTGIIFRDTGMTIYLPVGSLWVRKSVSYNRVKKVIISGNWLSRLFGLYTMQVIINPKLPLLAGLANLLNLVLFLGGGGSYGSAYSYKISGLSVTQVEQIRKELLGRNINTA